MPAFTSPDNIQYPVSTDQVAPLETVFANMAQSTQNALDGFRTDWDDFEGNHAIQTFRWADATARAAQTGMQAGDVGYQIDTATSYIYTGSVWIMEASGLITMIPSSAVNGTIDDGGLVTFSTASSVSVNGAFSTAFSEYLIRVTLNSGSTAGSAVRFRTRTAGGADSTGANYSDFSRVMSSVTPSNSYAVNATACFVGYVDNTAISAATIRIEVSNPTSATLNTPVMARAVSQDRSVNQEGGNRLQAAYTGFTIYPDSGTFTGSLKVYGYA